MLDEVGGGAVVAEDLAQAALQREAGDADIEAGANAGQAVVLVGQRVRHSACFDSHLRQQGQCTAHPLAWPQHAASQAVSKLPIIEDVLH